MTAINWTELGTALRECADDAHDGETPDVRIAYAFLLDQDEYIVNGHVYVPADQDGNMLMPDEPPAEFVNAYYGVPA